LTRATKFHKSSYVYFRSISFPTPSKATSRSFTLSMSQIYVFKIPCLIWGIWREEALELLGGVNGLF